LLLVVCQFLPSQTFRQTFPTIRFVQEGIDIVNPFSGGIDTPIHQFVDIDGDGDFDLFILDRDGLLVFYRNEGSPTQARYVIAAVSFQNLGVGSWFRFVDIDADGDFDLFAGGANSTVRFYRNIGNVTSPSFRLEIPTVQEAGGGPLLSESISIPAFADMDGDGDFDFFSGNSVGSIWYYENIGTPSQFHFRFITDRYQNILIIGAGGTADTASTSIKRMHGAMAIDFADIDADGDLDLFWGDFFNQSLYFLENQGTPTAPKLVLLDSTFSDEAPVLTNGFNMPQLVDIDGDGDLDLFIGALFGQSIDTFQKYRNEGTRFQHRYQLETKNFVSALDVGAASSPLFVDLDGDGDRDLLLGSESGPVVVYERMGTAANPEFHRRPDTLMDLSGLFNISLAAGDIDNDGVLEFIVGDFNGRLRLYRMNGSRYLPAPFQFDGATFGLNAAPALVDIDADGDLDLFVGNGGGRIYHYRNEGIASSPNLVFVTDFFGSIDVGDDAKPVFVDLDGDGDLDLVIGAREGGVQYWRNEGTREVAAFNRIARAFQGFPRLLRSAPALDDLDGDGHLDLLVGNLKGGIYFFSRERGLADLCEEATELHLHQNFPNPFSSQTTILICSPQEEEIQLRVYDLVGREVALLFSGKLFPGVSEVHMNAGLLPSGVYFYKLHAGNIAGVKKMVLVR
jgi:hypothetical protein